MEFTRQLVVQAQGARIIKRRNAGDDEGAAALLEHCRSDEDCDSDGSGLDVDEEGLLGDGRVDWPNGGVAEREADQAPAPAPSGLRAVNAAVRAPTYHLRRVALSTIAQWPGLSGIAAALELPEDEWVRLSSRISFMAVFECGWTVEQLLYASPCFRGASCRATGVRCSSGRPLGNALLHQRLLSMGLVAIALFRFIVYFSVLFSSCANRE